MRPWWWVLIKKIDPDRSGVIVLAVVSWHRLAETDTFWSISY